MAEKAEVACGWGFWLWARRRVLSIPRAGCQERANEAHGQKHRCPEGFHVQAGCTLAAPGQTGLDPKTGCSAFSDSLLKSNISYLVYFLLNRLWKINTTKAAPRISPIPSGK